MLAAIGGQFGSPLPWSSKLCLDDFPTDGRPDYFSSSQAIPQNIVRTGCKQLKSPPATDTAPAYSLPPAGPSAPPGRPPHHRSPQRTRHAAGPPLAIPWPQSAALPRGVPFPATAGRWPYWPTPPPPRRPGCDHFYPGTAGGSVKLQSRSRIKACHNMPPAPKTSGVGSSTPAMSRPQRPAEPSNGPAGLRRVCGRRRVSLSPRTLPQPQLPKPKEGEVWLPNDRDA